MLPLRKIELLCNKGALGLRMENTIQCVNWKIWMWLDPDSDTNVCFLSMGSKCYLRRCAVD